jgi:hypothetical protein
MSTTLARRLVIAGAVAAVAAGCFAACVALAQSDSLESSDSATHQSWESPKDATPQEYCQHLPASADNQVQVLDHDAGQVMAMSGRSLCEAAAAQTPPSDVMSRAGLVAVYTVRTGQVTAEYHNIETLPDGSRVGAIVSPDDAAQRLAATK